MDGLVIINYGGFLQHTVSLESIKTPSLFLHIDMLHPHSFRDSINFTSKILQKILHDDKVKKDL